MALQLFTLSYIKLPHFHRQHKKNTSSGDLNPKWTDIENLSTIKTFWESCQPWIIFFTRKHAAHLIGVTICYFLDGSCGSAFIGVQEEGSPSKKVEERSLLGLFCSTLIRFAMLIYTCSTLFRKNQGRLQCLIKWLEIPYMRDPRLSQFSGVGINFMANVFHDIASPDAIHVINGHHVPVSVALTGLVACATTLGCELRNRLSLNARIN